MKMAVGSDSATHFATTICAYLEEKGVELLRCGQCCGEQADYVDAARAWRSMSPLVDAIKDCCSAPLEPA